MDDLATTESTSLTELLAVQGILAGATGAIDEAERALPPVVCTWQGTAREAYALNLDYLRSQLAIVVASVADARADITDAIALA